jgi:hypothetical protein
VGDIKMKELDNKGFGLITLIAILALVAIIMFFILVIGADMLSFIIIVILGIVIAIGIIKIKLKGE